MRLQHLALVGALAIGATACNHDSGPFYPPEVQLAFVRWVNAVPDTGSLDFRFVDQVEYSPWYGQLEFRQMSNYQGAQAGTRHIRVFPGGSSDIDVVSQVVLDTTLTLEAGKYYTILHTGYARAGSAPKQHFELIEDPRPSVGDGQIAARAINAIVGAAVDIYWAEDEDPSPTVFGAPAFEALTYLAASNYTTAPTSKFAFRVALAGDAGLMAQAVAPAGHPPESVSQTAQGGYSIGGSMLTAFVFPASVDGSGAPQSSKYKTAAVIWMQDNRPGS